MFDLGDEVGKTWAVKETEEDKEDSQDNGAIPPRQRIETKGQVWGKLVSSFSTS